MSVPCQKIFIMVFFEFVDDFDYLFVCMGVLCSVLISELLVLVVVDLCCFVEQIFFDVSFTDVCCFCGELVELICFKID